MSQAKSEKDEAASACEVIFVFAVVKKRLSEILAVVAFVVVTTLTYSRVTEEIVRDKNTRETARMETYGHADKIKSILANQLNCLATFDGMGSGTQLGPSPAFSIYTDGKKSYTTGEKLGQSGLQIEHYRITNTNAWLMDRTYELQITFKGPSGETYQRTVSLRVNDNRMAIGPLNPCVAFEIKTTDEDRAAGGGPQQ